MESDTVASRDDATEVIEAGSGSEWLGTTAAARRLGITTRTLYRFINEGEITAYRMGRVIRVRVSDIDNFIEACRIEPGTIGHLYPTARPASGEESGDDAEESG